MFTFNATRNGKQIQVQSPVMFAAAMKNGQVSMNDVANNVNNIDI
tara:strand:+ start:91 stop:225 length:135 start_codon:yes stop_codon:yes gene_type:complete